MATAIGIQQEHSELRHAAARYGAIGLTIAVAFHFTGIGSYWLVKQLVGSDGGSIVTGSGKPAGYEPPTWMDVRPFGTTQGVQIATTITPDRGVPVIVPDADVSPEQTIMDQNALRQLTGTGAGSGNGTSTNTSGENSTIDSENVPPPDTFRAFEKYPEFITEAKAEYPEMARRVGLQGRVVVNIWVDKRGVPKKAMVLKSDGEIFNQAAINAAMQCRFTPAIMNKGPVSVWISIPFTFRLKQSQ
ncbi:MAG TPA: energy transducer TonB [Candidatus Kryptonia bacterium]